MNESTKIDLQELTERLEEQIFKLSTFLEDNENIDIELWTKIDSMINRAVATLSNIQEIINYS